jgi:hypothetical protein
MKTVEKIGLCGVGFFVAGSLYEVYVIAGLRTLFVGIVLTAGLYVIVEVETLRLWWARRRW